MLQYRDEVKRLVSTFFAYRNDVDIYTEDEDKDKEFYRVLFSRLLESKIIINDITPLGCRQKVIERCKNEPESKRKKVFVVDGDIGVVNGEVIAHHRLFVLDRYCIENFLLDEESTCSFVYLNCGTKSRDQIRADIEYQNWLSSYSESLINLFIHFGIIHSFGSKFSLFNANKYHVLENSNWLFRRDLVAQDIECLKAEIISKYGKEQYEQKLQELQLRWTCSIDNLLTIVSGKDYLIPMLLIKTQMFKKSKSLPSLAEVKINLVQHFDVSKLRKLKEFIEAQ